MRVLKQKYAETLNGNYVTTLDTQVKKLLEESQPHNSLIWHTIQEIAPYRPMSEYEEKMELKTGQELVLTVSGKP